VPDDIVSDGDEVDCRLVHVEFLVVELVHQLLLAATIPPG
jgi:hypothetical protein